MALEAGIIIIGINFQDWRGGVVQQFLQKILHGSQILDRGDIQLTLTLRLTAG